jgi:aspartyl-tRNA(Asn)/glutamyl-tRNA(Gln) amidotransferase subunit A
VPAPLGTLAELRSALDAGTTSSQELVAQSLERAEALHGELNCFIGLRADAAREEALAADARRKRGEARSLIDGVPVAIKDNMVQAGEPTTCASRILAGFVSPYTSTVVQRLVDAGAVVIGRTNMD